MEHRAVRIPHKIRHTPRRANFSADFRDNGEGAKAYYAPIRQDVDEVVPKRPCILVVRARPPHVSKKNPLPISYEEARYLYININIKRTNL